MLTLNRTDSITLAPYAATTAIACQKQRTIGNLTQCSMEFYSTTIWACYCGDQRARDCAIHNRLALDRYIEHEHHKVNNWWQKTRRSTWFNTWHNESDQHTRTQKRLNQVVTITCNWSFFVETIYIHFYMKTINRSFSLETVFVCVLIQY